MYIKYLFTYQRATVDPNPVSLNYCKREQKRKKIKKALDIEHRL